MSTNFTQLAPICFLYERDTENSKRITANLRSHFFNDTKSSDWLTFDGLKDVSCIHQSNERRLFSKYLFSIRSLYSYSLMELLALVHIVSYNWPVPIPNCIITNSDTLVASVIRCIQMINLTVFSSNIHSESIPMNNAFVSGAVHHDELLYLFRVPVMTPPFNKTDPENSIIENLTGWWANFAETG